MVEGQVGYVLRDACSDGSSWGVSFRITRHSGFSDTKVMCSWKEACPKQRSSPTNTVRHVVDRAHANLMHRTISRTYETSLNAVADRGIFMRSDLMVTGFPATYSITFRS